MITTKPLVLLSFLFFASFLAKAQTAVSDTGKVELVQEYKIKELLAKHTEMNSKVKLKGYRIKIHSGADRSKAGEVKAKFISAFSDTPAYGPIYDQPNWNIRVGDFRTKLEAYRFLKEVQVEFPAAFIVQDEIEFPSLDTPVKKP